MNRTIQDNSIEEIQADLDLWINNYNKERTHTGKYCFGRAPLQTFEETLSLAKEKQLDNLPPAA
ncbi:hypothetical protein ACDQ55_17425 [Chitinophaga sp. 30R24]|uniref:hypothetical protein n=1 Tax=Chitinophaga sp. 30R24 TaxID=3248838 RepID=UPI003B919B42